MIDRFGKTIQLGDIVAHVDGNKIFLGLVVRDRGSSVEYTIIQGSNYYYGVYGIKSSNRVIVLEQTPTFMNSDLKDYKGYSEQSSIGDAVKYTWDAYNNSK